MAGIYIHIPYCKEACSYCDFHFSIQLKDKALMVQAFLEELKLRKHELEGREIETIYFGGGTPSLLKIDELNQILELIHKEFQISKSPEITVEANPDDLIRSYVSELYKSGVNRLSIGIQSWDDEDLKRLNRKHSSLQAEYAINNTIEEGITNLSIDLIYGLPEMNMNKWQSNLLKSFSFKIYHLSAYHLTYEEGTVLDYVRKKKRIKPVEEDESQEEFIALIQEAERNGFKQYELSNFSKPGFESKHNSSYWNRVNYLGIGPSAHSFIGKCRSWNISNNKKYVEGIMGGKTVSESEKLSINEEFNEYIMTGLRLRKGIDTQFLKENFGEEKYNQFKRNISSYVDQELAEDTESGLRLTTRGMFLSDRIISDLMIVD